MSEADSRPASAARPSVLSKPDAKWLIGAEHLSRYSKVYGHADVPPSGFEPPTATPWVLGFAASASGAPWAPSKPGASRSSTPSA